MLQAAFMRTIIFTLFVSAVWASAGHCGQRDLHQGAMGYGILNGSMGFGAVIGATNLPRVRRLLSADAIIASSTGVFVATLSILALVKNAADHYSHADRRWVRLDQRHVYSELGGADVRSGLGAGTGAGRLPDDLCRGHGSGRSDLGVYRGARFHFKVADVRGCRPGGHSSLVAALPRAARSAARFQSPPLQLCRHRSWRRNGKTATGRYGCRSITISTRRTMPPLPKPFINCGMSACAMALFAGASTRTRRTRDISTRRLSPSHGSSTCGNGSASPPRIWRLRDRVWSFHRGTEPPRISHMFYAKEVSDSPVTGSHC